MMKKRFSLIVLLFCMIMTFSLPFSAEGDVDVSGDPVVSDGDAAELPDESEKPDVSLSSVYTGNDCLCGREYYTEDVGEHSKYDCIKCGKNMYACTCNCWCGASTVLDTSGVYGSVSPRLCSGCNKPCAECDCRDNKAEVLAAEKLRINGEVSHLNIPRPENGWNLFFALFTILLMVGAAVYLPRAPFMMKKSSVPEEEVDLSEMISFNSEDSEEKKPEKAYETPEDDRSDVKKNVVKPVQIKSAGVAVYEKINIPWMTSAGKIININNAAAKVLVNDSEIISGDIITLSEVSEKLMAETSAPVAKEARFPEFYALITE